MSRYSGVVPPVTTPLTSTHEVDFDSLTRVINRLSSAGVDGLFVLGTSSETTFYDEATRRKIIEHAAHVNNGKLPLFVGVIDPATDRSILHARVAKELGATAIVATAPFYSSVDQNEIANHYRYIREAIGIDVIAYDIPSCTHSKLERSTVSKLAHEGTIAGLKDSSGDERNLRYVLLDTADVPEFSVFTGSETNVDSALAMGAHGVVPGLGNVDPFGYVRLYQAFRRGDLAMARKEQERLCRLAEIGAVGLARVSLSSSLSGATKTALTALKVIATNTVARPQTVLNSTEVDQIRAILREVGLLNNDEPVVQPAT